MSTPLWTFVDNLGQLGSNCLTLSQCCERMREVLSLATLSQPLSERGGEGLSQNFWDTWDKIVPSSAGNFCPTFDGTSLLPCSRREGEKACPGQVHKRSMVAAQGRVFPVAPAPERKGPTGRAETIKKRAVSVPQTPPPVSNAWPPRRAFLILSGQVD